MNIDWQTILALLCVAAAALAVMWRVRGSLIGTTTAGCGAGCQSCPARKEQPLVQINLWSAASQPQLSGQPSKSQQSTSLGTLVCKPQLIQPEITPLQKAKSTP